MEWRPLPGYSGQYEISEKGHVRYVKGDWVLPFVWAGKLHVELADHLGHSVRKGKLEKKIHKISDLLKEAFEVG